MPSVDPTAPDRPLPGASPLVAYARYWRRYVVFSGRASLSEYWWVALVNAALFLVVGVVLLVLVAIAAVLGQQGSSLVAIPNALIGVVVLLLSLFALAQIVPGISISVRRLHDANFSGLLELLELAGAVVPLIPSIVLLVLHVMPSNEAGRRFDRGAQSWDAGYWQGGYGQGGYPPADYPPPASPGAYPPPASPAQPVSLAKPAPTAQQPTAFAAWPAPQPAPPTAPVPEQRDDVPADDPVRRVWAGQGTVAAVDPRLSGQPSWRRVGYLHVDRPDGVGILTTSGLAEAEGAAALGAGGEVYLASTALSGGAARAADGWEFVLVASVARRIGASGMNLPAELAQHGALSMAVPVQGAPAAWTTADGSVGVLIGVPLPGVPDGVATPRGEVRLVGLVPLLPEELQRILETGREARTAIAGDLNTLPAGRLASPGRTAV